MISKNHANRIEKAIEAIAISPKIKDCNHIAIYTNPINNIKNIIAMATNVYSIEVLLLILINPLQLTKLRKPIFLYFVNILLVECAVFFCPSTHFKILKQKARAVSSAPCDC